MSGSHADADDDVEVMLRPRLCRLKMWPDFNGYGFDLHVNDQNHINHVGNIEPGSPAEATGLKEGDRIVEVNGASVTDDPHSGDVFARINEIDDRVSLLVVDPATEQHYRRRGVVVDGHMKQVLEITCPDVNPATAAAVAVSIDSVTLVDAGPAEPETHPHVARLCVVRLWHDGRGYGFTVLAGRGRPELMVGGVDPGSPAAASGLRAGDRLVEVNGVRVEGQSHDAVASLIGFDPDTVSLLVVDADADRYFRHRDIAVTSDMPHCVERITCPETKPEAVAAAPPHGVRLCQLRTWPDADGGYGFSVETQRAGRAGHFIGSVDPASPAEATGLRRGDRVVEVNGVNVDDAPYQDVVDRVRAAGDHVVLLVVDPDADSFFSEHNIAISASMDCVETITCPETNPSVSTEMIDVAIVADGVNGADKKFEEVPRKPRPATGYVKVIETNAAKPSKKIDNEAAPVQAGAVVTAQTADGVMTETTAGNHETTWTSADDPGPGPSTVDFATTADSMVTESTAGNSETTWIPAGGPGPSTDGVVTEKAENSETTWTSAAGPGPSTVEFATTADGVMTEPVAENSETTWIPAGGPGHSTDGVVTETAAENSETTWTSTTGPGPSTVDFATTADEARRRMNKKKDVRSSKLSMKDKYDMYQKM